MPELAVEECAAMALPLANVAQAQIDEDHVDQAAATAASLKDISIFANLSAEELVAFDAVARPRSYKKGKMLYVEGEPASYFYVVQSGWVKLFHTMPEGDEVIMDMLTRGDLVGDSAIFENDRHTGSAQVIEDVHLLSIPLRTLKEQIVSNRNLALAMLLAMSRHHRRHCSERALNAMQSAPQRVGYFLLKLCPKNQAQGIIFRLPYNKTLIAETLGMKSETFSRSLNILRNKIGLRIKGSNVEIDSTERLAEFVYGSFSTKVMVVHNSF